MFSQTHEPVHVAILYGLGQKDRAQYIARQIHPPFRRRGGDGATEVWSAGTEDQPIKIDGSELTASDSRYTTTTSE